MLLSLDRRFFSPLGQSTILPTILTSCMRAKEGRVLLLAWFISCLHPIFLLKRTREWGAKELLSLALSYVFSKDERFVIGFFLHVFSEDFAISLSTHLRTCGRTNYWHVRHTPCSVPTCQEFRSLISEIRLLRVLLRLVVTVATWVQVLLEAKLV